MWRSVLLLLPTFLVPTSTYFSCSFLVSGVLDPTLCFGEAVRWTEAGFQLRMGWRAGTMSSLILRAGSDHISCSLCPQRHRSLLQRPSRGERRGSEGGHWNKER